MPDGDASPRVRSVWTRAIADLAFRAALIADPLRALADAPGLVIAPDQARQLEAMTPAEREETIRELIIAVARNRARQQWGDRFWSGDDPDAPIR